MIERRRLFWVLFFAVAMAWLEAAVVLYLRTLVERAQPYQQNPLPGFGTLGIVEMLREAATLAMLFAVGRLAGNTSRSRWAFSLVAFGIWDILYYLFLIPLTGWPTSLLDWDILFLLPVPWWGPVLAPVSVSLLLVAGGLLVVLFDLWPGKAAMIAGGTGIVLVLYAFMENSIRAPRTLPARFSWPWFLVGLALLAIPLLDIIRQVASRRARDAVR